MATIASVLDQHGIDNSTLAERPISESLVLYSLSIRVPELLKHWKALRALVPTTGYWPVVLTHTKMLDRPQFKRSNAQIALILEEASQIDLTQWFVDSSNFDARRWGSDELEAYPSAAWVLEQAVFDIEGQYEAIGDSFLAYEAMKKAAQTALDDITGWPGKEPYSDAQQLGLTFHQSYNDQSFDLILVPTTKAWEIPVLMNYRVGEGHSLAEHVQLWHSWATRYGAEPVELGGTGYTLRANRPPATAEEAILLSWEHSVYCFDSHDRMDIPQYAKELARGKAWWFWWD